MKTREIIVMLMLAFFAAACNSTSEKGYTLSGEISGLPEGSRIQLIPVSHESVSPLVDTLVTDGVFELTGIVEQPLAVLLKVKDLPGAKYMMLENGKISLTGNVKVNESNGYKSSDWSEVTVTGSPLTDYYQQLIAVRAEMDARHTAYTTEHAEVLERVNRARGEKNQQALDEIESTEAYAALMADEKDFFTTVERSYKQVVMDHKDSYWGPLMMITLMSYFTDDNKEWYEQFTQEAKESYYGKKVFEELYPAGSVGSVVPEFTVKESEGNEISFAELRAGKRYILIDFWASWCNPCLKEIPHLKSLYEQYGNQGFEIVSISIDENEEDWIRKSEEVQLPWPSFLDNSEIDVLYKVRVVPTMYLVDEKGVLVAENLRGEDLDSKLAELFVDR